MLYMVVCLEAKTTGLCDFWKIYITNAFNVAFLWDWTYFSRLN